METTEIWRSKYSMETTKYEKVKPLNMKKWIFYGNHWNMKKWIWKPLNILWKPLNMKKVNIYWKAFFCGEKALFEVLLMYVHVTKPSLCNWFNLPVYIILHALLCTNEFQWNTLIVFTVLVPCWSFIFISWVT